MRVAMLLLAVTGCGDNLAPSVSFVDAPFMCPINSVCNPLTQGGCSPGQRCAVVVDTTRCPVPVACVEFGPIAIGDACSFSEVYEHVLADDCGQGAMCVQGTCRQLCDPNGGMPACTGAERCEVEAMVVYVGTCSGGE